MIRYEQIDNLLVPKGAINHLDHLISIFLEYCKIKDLLEHPSKQSWYFKKGIASQKNKIEKLEGQWEEIRKIANQYAVDDLILEQTKYEFEIKKTKASGSTRLIKSLVINSHQSQINQICTALEIKGRVKELPTIEYYFGQPEEFMEVFDN
jgi:oligoribonuclease NrnB/cAMP/cGMP phosphodiesterase (DHH superfamily)